MAKVFIFIPLALFAAPAVASDLATSQETGTVHRLSAAEVEALKEAAADRVNRNTVDGLEVNDRSAPQVHGEVGFAVGTGGYTSVFGTAVVPLGSDAVAAISFERAQFNDRRFRARR